MKKILLILLPALFSLVLLSGCSSEYEKDLKVGYYDYNHDQFYKEWTGEGDFTTGKFSISFKGNYPNDEWNVFLIAYPFHDDPSVRSSLAQVTIYNADTGKECGVVKTDDRAYMHIGCSTNVTQAGTFYLDVKSTDCKWILRAYGDVREGEPSEYTVTAGVTASIDISKAVPVGYADWWISGKLTKSGVPVSGASITIYENNGNDMVKYDTQQTDQTGGYSSRMYPISEVGTYTYRVEYVDDPNDINSFADVWIMALHRANLKLTFPDSSEEQEYYLHAGQDFAVTVSMHDYLGDDPLSGAGIYLEYKEGENANWNRWPVSQSTDSSGKAVFVLTDPVFPKAGNWQVRAFTYGAQCNGFDYQSEVSNEAQVVFEKGLPIVELSLYSPPSSAFSPFQISCSIKNEKGESISGDGLISLSCAPAGTEIYLPLTIKVSSSSSESIIYDVSLPGGNYSIKAEFKGNDLYDPGDGIITVEVK